MKRRAGKEKRKLPKRRRGGDGAAASRASGTTSTVEAWPANELAQVSSTTDSMPSTAAASDRDDLVLLPAKPSRLHRIKGIPLGQTKEDVFNTLKGTLVDETDDIEVHTLALDVHGSEQVAVIRLVSVSQSKLGLFPPSWELDEHFHGMTVLHCPPDDVHGVDIIAVSGLWSHAYGSFKVKNGKHMWLADSIPLRVPSARVATYGYESALDDSQSFQNLYDLGNRLLRSIEVLQGATRPRKPIIFIAHSLGGLILKQAIVQLSNSTSSRTAGLMDSIYGAMFFGVPNTGLDIQSFIPIVRDGPNRFLIESLGQHNSQILQSLHTNFKKSFDFQGSSEIHYFYETRLSQIVKKDNHGYWVRSEERKVLVSKTSAIQCRTWEDTDDHITALARDHSNLVKFGRSEDDLATVIHLLDNMVKQCACYAEQRRSRRSPGQSSDIPEQRRLESLQVVDPRLCKITNSPVAESSSANSKARSTKSISVEQRNFLLESLHFDQIYARRQNIEPAHGQTCEWILETKQYLDWLNPNTTQQPRNFLWINGKPGAGKSTLMRFALDTALGAALETQVVINFFFNARGAELEKSTTGMYRSLLHQLLKLGMSLESSEYSTKEDIPREWHIEPLKTLFGKAVLALKDKALACYIDALDECNEDQVRNMVSFFTQLSRRAASSGIEFRVCFASRHYPSITMEGALNLIVEDQKEHSQDISNYLEAELKIGTDPHAQSIRSEVMRKASGVFVWVVLVVKILQKECDRGNLHTYERRLRDIPGSLHELYNDILNRGLEFRKELVLCIQWVLFAKKPLTPRELFYAIHSGSGGLAEWHSSDGHKFEAGAEKYILNCSRGLTEITKSSVPAVQFIHESVRDFLLQQEEPKGIWEGISHNIRGESHEQLKKSCSVYLSTIFPQISLFQWNEFDDRRHMMISKVADSFPFARYAVENILYHADAAEECNISQQQFLEDFPWTNWIDPWTFYHALSWGVEYFPRIPRTASLFRILAQHNLLNLIKSHCKGRSCFQEDEENEQDKHDAEVGCSAPIFVAGITGGYSFISQLLKIEIEHEPPSSPLRRLYNIFCQSKRDERGRFDLFWGIRSLLASLIYADEAILLEFALVSRKAIAKLESAVFSDGTTPLSLACSESHEEIVKILLTHGAQVEAKDGLGRTPLSHVADNDKGATNPVAIASLLLDWGAELDSRDDKGRTPLSYVAESKAPKAVTLLSFLLDRGAQVESIDDEGRSPLFYATMVGDRLAIKILLNKGAQPERLGRQRCLSLLRAAAIKDAGLLVSLLDRGVPVDMADDHGYTPLFYAIHDYLDWGHNEPGTVGLLLSRDAGASIIDLVERDRLLATISTIGELRFKKCEIWSSTDGELRLALKVILKKLQ